MKEFFESFNGKRVLQIALISGIVFLAYNQIDGWGMTYFLYFFAHYKIFTYYFSQQDAF